MQNIKFNPNCECNLKQNWKLSFNDIHYRKNIKIILRSDKKSIESIFKNDTSTEIILKLKENNL